MVMAALAATGACSGGCRDGGDGVGRGSSARAAIESSIAASGAEVGLYYRSLASQGDSITINPDVRMHAASTMKVPVMMQLYLDHQDGLRSLDSTMRVTRTFRSIVDGSPYELPADSDSDTAFYARVGQDARSTA